MKHLRNVLDESREVVFTLMERGAPWPENLSSLLADANESVVVVQGAAETMSDFAERAQARLGRLRRTGRAIRRAVLVASGASSLAALSTLTSSAGTQWLVVAGTGGLSHAVAAPL